MATRYFPINAATGFGAECENSSRTVSLSFSKIPLTRLNAVRISAVFFIYSGHQYHRYQVRSWLTLRFVLFRARLNFRHEMTRIARNLWARHAVHPTDFPGASIRFRDALREFLGRSARNIKSLPASLYKGRRTEGTLIRLLPVGEQAQSGFPRKNVSRASRRPLGSSFLINPPRPFHPTGCRIRTFPPAGRFA